MTNEITVTFTAKVTREGNKWGIKGWALRTIEDWRILAEGNSTMPDLSATAAAMVAYIEARQPWQDAKPGDVLDVKVGGQWLRGVVNDHRVVELRNSQGVYLRAIRLNSERDAACIEDSRLLDLPKPGECRE